MPFTLHAIFARHSTLATLKDREYDYDKNPRSFPVIDYSCYARGDVHAGCGAATTGESGQASEEDLVKETQNPVADLITVPLQNNFNFGTGSKNRTVYVGNIQPVIPIHLTDDWNLITRTIMPIINQPSVFQGTGSATGLGDINPTFFFSPAKPGELIWGAGPTFTLPTATDSLLGAGKFSLGPAAVALTMQGHWVVGALMNNQWSVAGWGSGHCQPDAHPAVRELQPTRSLVSGQRSDHDGQLGGSQGR